MLVHEIDDLLHAKPFVPFTVVTSDGRHLPVKSREFAWHPEGYRTVWIATGSNGDRRVHMVDLQLVTQFVIESSTLPITEPDPDSLPGSDQ